MVIYKITNTINGKVYIGQTINAPEKRWKEHCKPSRCKVSAISYAIAKYGKDHFVFEVVDKAKDMNELNAKEVWWIHSMNSIAPNGYNLNSGGSNYKDSMETRNKKSEAGKRRIFSEGTRLKMSIKKAGVPVTAIAKYRQKLGKHLVSTFSTTGKGVRYDKRGNAYQAFIYIDGVIKSKYFSYSIYGKEAVALAIKYRVYLEEQATEYYNLKIKEALNG